MRLTTAHHRQRDWLVHGLLDDFDLDEVWSYPIVADPARGEDFAYFCAMAKQTSDQPGGATGFLFKLRLFLGRVFGWDKEEALPIPGATETSIADRLPQDRRLAPGDEETDSFGFKLVYALDNERLVELSNSTVHAALHMGWVTHDDGTAGAELAVYWKPRGWFGRLYMALITPFRVFIVYPALMRKVATDWERWRTTSDPTEVRAQEG